MGSRGGGLKSTKAFMGRRTTGNHAPRMTSYLRWGGALLAAVVWSLAGRGGAEVSDIDAPPHNYSKRTPADRFSRLQASLSAGQVPLDRASEKAFLVSLLQALEIPVTSQLLVFSTTSLQLSLISPANPRALYFNEDTYVGYIPGGRIEIVSLDPDLGGIFYIFDIPRGDRPLTFERSGRCINCHAREDAGHVPGLVAKSVLPGPGGGSLTAYRVGQSGHGIPMDQRFGGWHVTGAGGFTNHWGNLTGTFSEGRLTTHPNPPGERFSYERYPAKGSDFLAHLLHEHQVGFVNRVLVATYLARQLAPAPPGTLSPADEALLDEQARGITRYLLFADEVPLPAGGVAGDPGFKADFLKQRRSNAAGWSLKDLDLQTRLLRWRCSYMIYSPVFVGLPAPVKARVYRRLAEALIPGGGDSEFAYLSASEKEAIRSILRATLVDLPAGW